MSESVNTFSSWHSYPKIFALGHRALSELLLDPVEITEKVDGSFIGFGLYDGEYKVRSKGAILNLVAPEKMFKNGTDVIQTLPLTPNWMYCGEYLKTPKHNSLVYDRTPAKHIILFNIKRGDEEYLTYDEMCTEADRIGLEVVPRIYNGSIDNIDTFRSMLNTVSVLGGQKIEGVVVKNYSRFGLDKKVLMGKFVSEEFKEVHAKEWKDANPKSGDIVNRLIEQFKTPARWNKAVQHLKESGQLEGSPKDIGLLIKEVQSDVVAECEDDIKTVLYNWAIPNIRRGVTGGLPEWYKDKLLAEQFNQ